ncbi:DUF4190 domain-containing protein [Demequina sp. NBRC 110055]|uniref:DUF4190 domain-containing protein n=1 Tax=Demequina sp. NBRC 110055 TaxID=1570344 RepID=UPI001F26B96F|nr:DUF4190 domain-containing protein [Demequina sp. NBRC 110055]
MSLCFGIAAVLFAWIPYIGMILGAVAVVCGHVAMRQLARSLQPRSGKGLAIAGLITGYAGILFSIIGILFLMAFTSALNSSFS